jgi:glutamate racemase
VIGTIATIGSRAYDDAFTAAPDVTLTSAACPRLAEFVERGVTSGRQLLGLVESYLTPIASADVDTLILGCTHYPLLTGVIATVLGPEVALVSSAEETAQDVYRELVRTGLARSNLDRSNLARSNLDRSNLARSNLARSNLARSSLAGATSAADGAEPPRHRFECTGPAEPFARLSRRFLGGALADAAAHDVHVPTPIGGR